MEIDYTKTAKDYKENNYVVIKNFISKELAGFLYDYGRMMANKASWHIANKFAHYNPDTDGTYNDSQAPGSYSNYADAAMETLLSGVTPGMRKITGLNLTPTYSYWRLYVNGAELKRHKDRPSCEVSTTLCLGYDNSNLKGKKENWQDYNWPMWVEKSGHVGKKGVPIYMKPGDMIVYRGCLIEHWREKFLGNNHAQVFLHYNDLDGPYGENCKFDGRPALGLPSHYKSKEKMAKMNKIDEQLLEDQKKEYNE